MNIAFNQILSTTLRPKKYMADNEQSIDITQIQTNVLKFLSTFTDMIIGIIENPQHLPLSLEI